jgi:hypothetical protein
LCASYREPPTTAFPPQALAGFADGCGSAKHFNAAKAHFSNAVIVASVKFKALWERYGLIAAAIVEVWACCIHHMVLQWDQMRAWF